MSQASELSSLVDSGIAAISLASTDIALHREGRRFLAQGSYHGTCGTLNPIPAVILDSGQVNMIFPLPANFAYDPDVFAVPNLVYLPSPDRMITKSEGERGMSVAQRVLARLGGALYVTSRGGSNIVDHGDGVSLSLPASQALGLVNRLTITLDPDGRFHFEVGLDDSSNYSVVETVVISEDKLGSMFRALTWLCSHECSRS